MECLNDDTIQKYLDNEIPGDSRNGISAHLDKCKMCRSRLEEIQHENEELLDHLSLLDPVDIPVMTPLIKHNTSRRLWPLIPAAVASILLILFLIPEPKNETQANLKIEEAYYEYMNEQDPNLLWKQQSSEIIIENSNGELIILN